ncbi:MAG: glycosyltransferase family 87 protein [bacterium]
MMISRRSLLSLMLAMAFLWLSESARYGLSAGWDSDIVRLWVVSQYIKQRVDPWRVSYETLHLNYGPASGENRERIRNLRVFEVHPHLRTDGITGVIPEFGPPTSTYPPPGMLIFTFLAGWVPQAWLLPGWMLVNFALILALAWALLRWRQNIEAEQAQHVIMDPEARPSMISLPAPAFVLLLSLAWPPVQEVVRTSQYGILMALLILVGFLTIKSSQFLAGICFSLALFKPHVTLPYLIVPLLAGRWRTLATIAVTQLIALLGIAWWLHTPPWTLIGTWLAISPYMFQGAYTVQELINAAGFGTSPFALVIPLLMILFSLGWCWWNRECPPFLAVSFLSLVSVFWMYHERYDYVVLLMPIVAACLLERFPDGRGHSLHKVLLPAFVLLGLGLSDYAYLSDHPIAHVVRWMGRLSLYGLLVCFAWLMRRRPARTA